jgi:hypothetical protein
MKLNFDQRTSGFRAIGAVCVLLVGLTGFITAVHVHPARTSTPERSCSACALAHVGAVPVELVSAVPVLVSSGTPERVVEQRLSFSPDSSLYIRPPPLA